MIISVASGKGGTGKTTVAAGLASIIKDSVYLDCDVEEPNGHLLLNPEIVSVESSVKLLPEIDYNICTFCGTCVDVCEFNALVNLKFEIVLFEEMCHSCGACGFFCPSHAISERKKEIGIVRTGKYSDGNIYTGGILNIGEVTAVPLISEVKKKIDPAKTNIIDSPPGTSCSMVDAVKNSDYCILVTESSPFGLSDLKLAVEVLRTLGIPFGVVINKYNSAFTETEKYLKESNIDLLLKIIFDRKYAEAYSTGCLPSERFPELKKDFISLYKRIVEISEEVDAG